MVAIIEIRPHRNGWKLFEAPGEEPFFIGDHAKEQALDYAQSRSAFRCGEIRIFDANGNLEQTIPFDESNRTL